MTRTMFGTAVGAVLGFAFIVAGFGDMLIVALFAAIGFGVAKVVAGEVDLSDYISRRNR